jgi:rare lipoprotein A
LQARVVVTAQVWYDSRVRRLAFSACVVLFLSACGGRKARVVVPGPVPTPASEMEGLASYYAEPYHGRRTANGEIFDTYKEFTAAHRTLPFNTVVRVTNKSNGQEVDVRINDRGPFIDGRIIDLSLVAARKIDMVRAGIVPVRLSILKAAETASAAPSFYAVQVGAFEDRRRAEELQKRLESKYSGVSIQTASGEKTVYRVRVGRESDLLRAHKLASQLREDDLETFVVPVQ